MESKKLSEDEKNAIALAHSMYGRDEFLKRLYLFIDDRVQISVDFALKREELDRKFIEHMKEFKSIIHQK